MEEREDELRRWVAAYYPRVRRQFGYLIADGATADDLSQEVFARLWVRLGKPSEVTALGGFIKGIMRNVFLEHLRAKAGACEQSVPFEEFADGNVHQPHDIVACTERGEKLAECLGALEDHERRLIVSRYVLEMTGRELSELTGEPRTTVAYQLDRAVEKLRRLAAARKLEL